MQILKADTQVIVPVGPAVDINDGYTLVTTLDISTADAALLVKYNNATAVDISGRTFAVYATPAVDGYYKLTLTTSDTDTEGYMSIMIEDVSLCLPIRQDYMVVNANVYDSLYAVAATDSLDVNVASFDAGAITAAAIATGAVDADAIAADAVTEIARGIMPTTNATLNNVEFAMVLSSDHATAATGLTVTGERSIDGGAFAALDGSSVIAEVSDGIYQADLVAADTNGTIVTYRFSSATADDTFLTIRFV